MSAYPSQIERIAVAVIFAVLSIFGLASNFLATIALLYNPVRRNAFSVFCFSHITASIGALLVCLLWISPLSLRDEEPSISLINKIMGQLVTVVFYATSYAHLAVSINRLIAVAWPLKGATMLTRQKSLCTVSVVWSLGLSHTIPHFWRASCYVYYESSLWRWILAKTTCGTVLSYVNKVDVLLILATLILDCIAILKFRKYNKINSQNTNVQTNNNMQQRKRHLETRLFKQALCQHALFLIIIVSFHLFPLFNNRWLGFLTAILWQLYHSLDGFIILAFHFQSSSLKKTLEKLFHHGH